MAGPMPLLQFADLLPAGVDDKQARYTQSRRIDV